MKLDSIKNALERESIFYSEDQIFDKPTMIGYDKQFRWSWMATQLNTFIVATDFGEERITKTILEEHITDSFHYAKRNYKGWPRGLQSALGVIVVLLSTNIDEEAIVYCKKLKSGKKWAGFSIPVVINTSNDEIHHFDKNPIWGRIYYPYFRKMIKKSCCA